MGTLNLVSRPIQQAIALGGPFLPQRSRRNTESLEPSATGEVKSNHIGFSFCLGASTDRFSLFLADVLKQ